MRHPRPLFFALVLAAASARAALVAPAFREALLVQVRVLDGIAAQPTPSLTPLLAAPADPVAAQAARLVGAFAARPQAIAAQREALRAALGDEGVATLEQAAARLAARRASHAELDAQLATLGREAAVDDAAALDRFFENARALSSGGAVSAGDGPEKKASVSLSKPGEKPAMPPAELERDVAERSVVSARGLKRVNFASGDYRPEYDAELRRQGVDQVVIKDPSRAELDRFKEDDGYHLKPEYVRWVMTTRTLGEHLEALGDGRHRKQFRAKLALSEDLPREIGPLTVEKFEQWYPIYEGEVVGKPGGKRNVARDFAAKLAAKGQLDKGWYGLFYYDPKDRTKMVGGVIMKTAPERGMFILGYAAYRPELKDMSPSDRTFVTAMEKARELGFKVLSFGQDTDFFGFDYNLGLMSNKAGFLLTPYPEVADEEGNELVLMKMLDSSKIAAVKNKAGKTGGYFFFGIKRDSPFVERYLQAREAGKPLDPNSLLGGAYFSPDILPAKDVVVGRRFKGDDPNPLRAPHDVEIVETSMFSDR